MSFITRRATPAQSLWYADQSANSAAVIRYGNGITQVDEGYGIRAASFDGSSSWLDTSVPGDFPGDFTVEFFGKSVGGNIEYYIGNIKSGDTSNTAWAILVRGDSNKIRVSSANTGYDTTGSFTESMAQWNHVAVCKSGTTLNTFFNGRLLDSRTSPLLFTNTTGIRINNLANNLSDFRITGVRVVKGTALYTRNFTIPTTLPTAVPGTALLMNFGATTSPLWYANSTTFNSVSSAGGVSLADEGFGVDAGNFNNSYLALSGSNPDISSGDFTIELFVNFSSAGTYQPIIFRGVPTGVGSFLLHTTGTSVIAVARSTNGSTHDIGINSTFTPKINTWYHIAFSSSSGTGRLFVNGKLVASGSFPNAFNTNQQWLIGRFENMPSPAVRNFTGKMAGLRITNTALYTADFVCPTTLPAQVFGTQLLMNFGSSDAPTILANTATTTSSVTGNGTSTGSAYTLKTGELIPSAYFDGSGDLIRAVTLPSLSSFAFGTDPFTVECWVKPFATGDRTFLATADPTDVNGFVLGTNTSGKFSFTLGFNGASWSIIMSSTQSVTLSAWHHLAVTATASGTVSLFVNGMLGATATRSFSVPGANNNLVIGGRTVSNQYSNAKIAGVRVIKGVALYTSNFTPPATKITSYIPNTVFLTNFNSVNDTLWCKDNSPTSAAIYLSGNTSQDFEDLRTVRAYTNKNTQGYLTASLDGPIGTGDFDFSFFVKFDEAAATASEHIVYQASGGMAILRAANETIRVNQVGSGDRLTSSSTIADTNWHYVQVRRSSGTMTMFIDGINVGSATDNSNYSQTNVNFLYNITGNAFGAEIAGVRFSRSGSLSTIVPASVIQPDATTALLMNFGSADVPSLWYGDTSSSNKTVILSGTVTQSDEGNGTKSLTVQPGSRVVLANNNGFDFGTGDYTIELFLKAAGTLTGSATILEFSYNNRRITENSGRIGYYGAGGFGDNYYKGFCAAADIVNTWNHLAIVRQSGTTSLYFNGIKTASDTNDANFTSSGTLSIGARSGDNTNMINAAISVAGLRIIKGTALYTNNFAVPIVPPTEILGTQLLLNFNTTAVPQLWYRDESLTNTKVTILSGAVVQSQIATGVNAATFDGSSFITAYDSLSGLAFGTGNFTIEMFVYTNSTSPVFSTFVVGYHNGGIQFSYNKSTGQLVYGTANQTNILTANYPSASFLNAWHHIALVRSGGVATIYVDGTPIGSTSNSTNFASSSLRIGNYPEFGATQYAINGNITGLRVVKGYAVYTAPFNPPTTLPTSIPGTELLMDFGSVNWTNVGIPPLWYRDTSLTSKAVSLSGTVTQTTEAGGITLATLGGAGHVISPSSTDYNLTGDFTVEFFVKLPPASTGDNPLVIYGGGASHTGIYAAWAIRQSSSTDTLRFFRYDGTTTDFSFNATIPTNNSWNHVAASRTNNVLNLFLNGVLVNSYTTSVQFNTVDNAPLRIGLAQFGTGQGYYANASITGLRIVKGTGLYTSGFYVPTTPPTAIPGTSLLLNFDTVSVPQLWYTDRSTFVRSISLSGNVTQVNEGGGVIVADIDDGSLATSLLAIGTGDYTLETFINLDAGSGYRGNGIADFRVANDTNNALIYFGGAGSYKDFSLYAGGQHNMVTSIRDSVWHHVAVTRSSGTSRLFINGIKVGETTVSYNITSSSLLIGKGVGGIDTMQARLAGYRIVRGTAVYTADFVPPTSLPTNIAGTQLLLNFGATAVPAIWHADTSLTPRVIKPFGTVIPINEGSGLVVARFDGSTGYLTTESSTGYNLAGVNSTIEFWMYPTQYAQQPILNSTGSIHIHMMTDGALHVNNGVAADVIMPVQLNVWQHVAVVIEGSSKRVYLNGELKHTTSQLWNGTSNQLFIGKNSTANLFFNGSIAGMRIVKGTALYSSNFGVPTTPPTAVAGTELLLNFGATATPLLWYSDMSSVKQPITLNGQVSQANLGSGVISLSSSNTGYITTGTTVFNGIGFGDFTMEFFVRPNSTGFYEHKRLVSLNLVNANGTESIYIESALSTGRLIAGIFGDTQTYISNPVLTQGVWHHLALSRTGGISRAYLNGTKFMQATSTTALPTDWILTIGGWRNSGSSTTRLLDGAITGFRVVDSGLYSTDTFTVPTTLPTAINGTRLLLNFGATAAPTV